MLFVVNLGGAGLDVVFAASIITPATSKDGGTKVGDVSLNNASCTNWLFVATSMVILCIEQFTDI